MQKRLISLFIVDDHPLFRQGICAMVQTRTDMAISGQCDGGEDTAARIEESKPDVVLADLTLPGDSAYRLIARLVTKPVSTRVIALSVTDSLVTARSAIAAGASAVLTKASSSTHLVQAITRVHDGEWYFSPDIAGKLMERFVEDPLPDLGTSVDQRYATLTPREREVMLLLAEGRTPKEIAYTLQIARATVDVHKTNLMRKMSFSDLTDLIRFAMKASFILPVRWIQSDESGAPI